jgi:DNA-binding MarR family transcriptional regulator
MSRSPRTVGARSKRRDDARYEAMLAALMHFRIVVRTMRSHYKRVERACGVSGAHVWALAQIAAAPGIKVSELAQQLAIHQSTASNMVDKLQKAGLVSRARSSDDRRIVCLHATARGRGVLARAPSPVRGALQQALMQLPLARLAALRDELSSLVREMRADDHGAESLVLAELVTSRSPRPRVPRRARAARGSNYT